MDDSASEDAVTSSKSGLSLAVYVMQSHKLRTR